MEEERERQEQVFIRDIIMKTTSARLVIKSVCVSVCGDDDDDGPAAVTVSRRCCQLVTNGRY